MSNAVVPLQRRGFGETLRRDAWWVYPLVVLVILGGFVAYATWAAFQNAHYEFGPYLSPFYSPVLFALRDHHKHDSFIGPRFLLYAAALEMHPLDVEDRVTDLQREQGIGYCNITKCCTKVCPEHITITDNAIIPLKERVVDRHYDPLGVLVQLVRGRWGRGRSDRPEPVQDEPGSTAAKPSSVSR